MGQIERLHSKTRMLLRCSRLLLRSHTRPWLINFSIFKGTRERGHILQGAKRSTCWSTAFKYAPGVLGPAQKSKTLNNDCRNSHWSPSQNFLSPVERAKPVSDKTSFELPDCAGVGAEVSELATAAICLSPSRRRHTGLLKQLASNTPFYSVAIWDVWANAHLNSVVPFFCKDSRVLDSALLV